MKQAGLIVDDGEFEIYKSFSEARSYLVANIDWILSSFSETHHISKEDVIIVSMIHHPAAPSDKLIARWWGPFAQPTTPWSYRTLRREQHSLSTFMPNLNLANHGGRGRSIDSHT